MSSSADARAEVVTTILALERACLDAEAALVERRAPGVDEALAAQSALTERLRALFARTPAVAPGSDPQIAARLRGVIAYRDDQLRRLQSYRDELGRRLESIGKVRAFARTLGTREPSATYFDTQK